MRSLSGEIKGRSEISHQTITLNTRKKRRMRWRRVIREGWSRVGRWKGRGGIRQEIGSAEFTHYFIQHHNTQAKCSCITQIRRPWWSEQGPVYRSFDFQLNVSVTTERSWPWFQKAVFTSRLYFNSGSPLILQIICQFIISKRILNYQGCIEKHLSYKDLHLVLWGFRIMWPRFQGFLFRCEPQHAPLPLQDLIG